MRPLYSLQTNQPNNPHVRRGYRRPLKLDRVKANVDELPRQL